MKQVQIFLRLVGVLLLIVCFQNCSETSNLSAEDLAASSSLGLGGPAPAQPILPGTLPGALPPGTFPPPETGAGRTSPPGAAAPRILISCPTANTLVAGGSATCNASAPGAVMVSGYWQVNGATVPDSSKEAMTWTNIAQGDYTLQAFAIDTLGRQLSSETLLVRVPAAAAAPAPAPATKPITISCDAGAYENGTATCRAAVNISLQSLYWRVNGVDQGNSSRLIMEWANVPKGDFKIEVVAKDSLGNPVNVDAVMYKVLAVCAIPSGYVADPSSCNSPYTEGKTCRYTYNGIATGAATCGSDSIWH